MSAARHSILRDEDGQVMVFAAMLMSGLIAIIGLVTDGGMAFSQKRQLQNIADAAALAGAMQIDEEAYRASGEVVLDEAVARDRAEQYLVDEGGVDYRIEVGPDFVDVAVSRQAETSFLRIVGVNGFEISARSSASPRHGIEAAE